MSLPVTRQFERYDPAPSPLLWSWKAFKFPEEVEQNEGIIASVYQGKRAPIKCRELVWPTVGDGRRDLRKWVRGTSLAMDGKRL